MIYDNFEIIEKDIIKLFIDDINKLNDCYLECTINEEKIIVHYPDNFVENQYASVIGKLDEDNSFITEYILVYKNQNEKYNHLNKIKGQLNNYLNNLQLFNNTEPILKDNVNFEIIGTIIKYDENINNNAINNDINIMNDNYININKQNNNNYYIKQKNNINNDKYNCIVNNNINNDNDNYNYVINNNTNNDNSIINYNIKSHNNNYNNNFDKNNNINNNNYNYNIKNNNFNCKDNYIINNNIKNENYNNSVVNDNIENNINKEIIVLKEQLNIEKIKNKNLSVKIIELEKELQLEKNKNIILNQNINQLNIELNNKLKYYQDLINKIERQSLSNNNLDYSKEELFKSILEKDKEIKELRIKLSRYPFELKEGEKLMTLNFQSFDENLKSYSIICKNTDIFNNIEKKLYENHKEYYDTENYFTVNGNRIHKLKSLDENKINNNDIIILNMLDI